MDHATVEVKARCEDLQKMRDILKSRNATFTGTDIQTDTYFNVDKGRLKIREGGIENFLVFYDREDKAGPKHSDIVGMRTDSISKDIKEILTRSIGVLAVVEKKREIYWMGNVKVHLDEVAGLGTFIEVEAVDWDRNIGEEKLVSQCNECIALFGIRDEDLIKGSYSDMLMGKS